MTLRLADFSSEKDLNFICAFFKLPESSLFWSPAKLSISDKSQVYNKLCQDWGNFYFFLGEKENKICCVLIAYSVSPVHHRANLLGWLAPEFRKGVSLINFHTCFMRYLHNLNIHRVFGNVLETNTVAIRAAERFGYIKCGILPEYINNNGKISNAVIVTRSTEINSLERKYLLKNAIL